MHRTPRQAAHQYGVFTVDQAIAAGWSIDNLKYAVRSGHLVRLRRGAYVEAESELTGYDLNRLRIGQAGVAGALRVPAATVSHVSAIALRDLPLLETPTLPCITLEPPLRTRPADLHVHRQPIPFNQFDHSSDIKLTSVARSIIDLTREAGLESGVVAADAALHRKVCTYADLAAVYSESCRGRAGLTTGRALLESLDGKAESPLESISRLRLDGLPKPRTQVVILSATGQFIGRVDFYWDGLGLVGEADGQEKYTDDELWNEKIRQDLFSDHGLVTVRWGWRLARRPAQLRDRVERAMRQAANLRAAGIPVTAIVRPERANNAA